MNFTYAQLADGRNQKEKLELDMALSPTPEKQQETIDEANMRAMRQLGAGSGPKPVPLPHKRRNA